MSLYVMVDFNNEIKQKLYEKQLILSRNCTGDFETFDKFHITVKYLNDDDQDLNLAISAMQKINDLKYKKFEILAKDFKTFNYGANNEKSIYWIAVHNCFDLYRIKHDIEKCCNEVNYNMQTPKFKSYTPHITMGYNINEEKPFNKEFEAIPITVDNLCLWQSYEVNGTYMQNCLYRLNLGDYK